MERQYGFTLVEITIVLAIIGLLLGSVLQGQQMVFNSKIRSIINEHESVSAAWLAYQERYRQLPGDDDIAQSRWGGNGIRNGNGDGVIDGNWNDSSSETGTFWQHMRNDGLLVGARTGDTSFAMPRNAFDGDIGIQNGALKISGSVLCQSNIPAKAAMIIDTRIDDDIGDGKGSNTGNVQAILDGSSVAFGSSAAESYDINADGRYIVCRRI